MKTTLYIVVCALLLAGCASAAKKAPTASTTVPDSTAYDLSASSSIPETSTTAIETSAPAQSTRTPLSLSKKEIQTVLKKTGFYNGPIDGVFGPQSRKAIKAFQKANGLAVDGLCGMKTRETMLNYIE